MTFRALMIPVEGPMILYMVDALKGPQGYSAPDFVLLKRYMMPDTKFHFAGVKTNGVIYREVV